MCVFENGLHKYNAKLTNTLAGKLEFLLGKLSMLISTDERKTSGLLNINLFRRHTITIEIGPALPLRKTMYQLNADIDTEREEEEVVSVPTKAKSRPKKYAIVRRTLAEKLEEMALRRELDIPNDIDPFK